MDPLCHLSWVSSVLRKRIFTLPLWVLLWCWGLNPACAGPALSPGATRQPLRDRLFVNSSWLKLCCHIPCPRVVNLFCQLLSEHRHFQLPWSASPCSSAKSEHRHLQLPWSASRYSSAGCNFNILHVCIPAIWWLKLRFLCIFDQWLKNLLKTFFLISLPCLTLQCHSGFPLPIFFSCLQCMFLHHFTFYLTLPL